MAERVYLDWNATAPLRPEARAAMLAALDADGNPSSIHAEGRAARHLMEIARERVAMLVGASARDVIFTSGGTEANALALTRAIQTGREAAPRDRLLVSAVEHSSVRVGGRLAPEATEHLPVDPHGVVDLVVLAARLTRLAHEGLTRPLVSIMLANNETGVIQPIAEAAAIVHAAGGLLHVDAVQAAGKIPCHTNEIGADLMTLSAHKLGGPKGLGAVVKRADLHFAEPLIKGGGQERGQRAGTENVAGIAGFGAAAAAARHALSSACDHMTALRDRLEAGLVAAASKTVIFGASAGRLPNTTCFAVRGIKAETALIALDLDGLSVSSGSACSSGKVAASHVLAAMGVDTDLARGAIRVSVGHSTAEEDVDRFLIAWNRLVRTLLKEPHGIAA